MQPKSKDEMAILKEELVLLIRTFRELREDVEDLHERMCRLEDVVRNQQLDPEDPFLDPQEI